MEANEALVLREAEIAVSQERWKVRCEEDPELERATRALRQFRRGLLTEEEAVLLALGRRDEIGR